jgi:hypothetical protein
MTKTDWKVGDWAVFDLNIVQIKETEKYFEVSDGSISTSGHLASRLRPLTLRNKATAEYFDWCYKQLRTIKGERGFNYPDISRYFCDLALNAMDGDKDDKGPFDAAVDFLHRAKDREAVIAGVSLFR